jgi:hypothetical protein
MFSWLESFALKDEYHTTFEQYFTVQEKDEYHTTFEQYFPVQEVIIRLLL